MSVAAQPLLTYGVIDRVLALVGDALAVGIVLLAVNVGALDRATGIAMVGWALRSLFNPTITLSAIAGGLGFTSVLREPTGSPASVLGTPPAG